MAAKKPAVQELPTKEERLNSLIIKYSDFQREEAAIRKAKEYLRAEIESRFPAIREGEKESVVEVNGIRAALSYQWSTTVDPEKLYAREECRDAFWQLVKIPITDARNVLPDDILHEVSHPVLSPKPQLLIKAKKES